MNAIIKARAWSGAVAPKSRVVTPGVFKPPYGGAAFYGQAYRWEQVLHYKFWAFVAIKTWIRQIAGGPALRIGRILPKQESQLKRLRPISKALGGPREHEEFQAFDDEHPLVRLFRNPNGPDVAYDLWAMHILFKRLTGSAHWWVVKNKFGTPVELWVIPTHWMRMETDGDGNPVSYAVMSPWGMMQQVPYQDVVSFYDHSPLNRYEGFAVSQAISEWIDVYEAMTRTRLATFKNGAIPSFHVALGDAYVDPDEAMLNRFYSRWFARFQGEDRAGTPLITGPDIEVKPLGIAPNEIGFERGEDQIRDMTLAAYDVPKAVLGLNDAMTYGSVIAALQGFFTFAVNPELHYSGQVITEKIVKLVDDKGAAFWDERTATDPEMFERQLEGDSARGWITPNEARTLRGREPYPHGGDDPMVDNVPQPWVTGIKEEAPEFERAFKRALGSNSGASGGYTLPQRLTTVVNNRLNGANGHHP